MTSDSDIPSEYIGDADAGTSGPKPRSQLREFLSNPIEAGEIERYGSSKPRRKVTRAKLIHGKS